jgi:hypothetical protein
VAQIQTKFIANNAVTNAKLAQASALSVLGNSTGSTANVVDIAGTANQVLVINSAGTALAFGAINLASSAAVTGALSAVNGGTGLTSYATGDTLYASASNTLSKLGIGSTGQVLTVSGGVPTWASPATSGTVTSVALADGSTTPIYAISGSPVTSSGTLTFTLDTQSANVVFAGPSSGSAAQPTFRTLANADLSTITTMSSLSLPTSQLSGNISLTAQVSGILPVANGGTGDSSLTAHNVLIGAGTSAVALAAPGTAGQVLTSNGASADPTFQALPSGFQTLSQQITLASGDITNQYIDLAHPIEGSSASVNSLSFFVIGGSIQNKTVDYTVSLTGGAGGVTRVTFSGDLATGGNAALVSGDIIVADYAY